MSIQPRFLQIHTLTSYPAVLLNRDDAGLAKRVPYGGVVRTRISSQSLKRHWRVAGDSKWSFKHTGAPLSVRSRMIVEAAVEPRLRELAPKVDPSIIEAAGKALSLALYSEKAADPAKRQALLLGWREVDALAGQLLPVVQGAQTAEEAGKAAEDLYKDKAAKKVLSAVKGQAGALAAGLESALFGRMVTSDPAANTDAAIHVAHAFTVHQQETETDYFTVVDDLKGDSSDAGAAGVFDAELTSGLYYSYVVVDVPLLVANLAGAAPGQWQDAETDRALAATVVEHLIHLVATVTPGAKLGSTAPYAHASLTLVEAGSRQPRSLAAAFEAPVRAGTDGGYVQGAERVFFDYISRHDSVYGMHEARRIASISTSTPGAIPSLSLDGVAAWASDCVRAADVADSSADA